MQGYNKKKNVRLGRLYGYVAVILFITYKKQRKKKEKKREYSLKLLNFLIDIIKVTLYKL
jgi:hypothetical protein